MLGVEPIIGNFIEHVPTEYLEMLITVASSIIASSGFWLYLEKKRSKKDFRDQLLIGLAHDRIVYLGMQYIRRGHISQDEYENLHTYLYEPYLAMGGNGTAKKIIAEVDKLPIRENSIFERKKYEPHS